MTVDELCQKFCPEISREPGESDASLHRRAEVSVMSDFHNATIKAITVVGNTLKTDLDYLERKPRDKKSFWRRIFG